MQSELLTHQILVKYREFKAVITLPGKWEEMTPLQTLILIAWTFNRLRNTTS